VAAKLAASQEEIISMSELASSRNSTFFMYLTLATAVYVQDL
jgi:hypothetical protein